MKMNYPECLKALAKGLKKPLYIVGGSCRDALAGLKREGGDWDICAPVSSAEAVSAAASAGFTVRAEYKRTGTVHLSCGGEIYEYASFRSDDYVRGLHTPVSVYFTDDICADARRRDFKCNAVYYDICADQFVDPLGGIRDIAARRLTTVAPAEKVFGEDGLRLMRLCRIAAETGFTPSAECLAGARANAPLVKDVSPERIFSELRLILAADGKYGITNGHYRGLELMRETGVLDFVIPELALGRGMEQRADFHAYDVEEHSLRCAMYAPAEVRLAALLHDVGKPAVKLKTGRYASHEVEGERIARDILRRLRAPTRLTEETCALVRWHMYDYTCEARESKVRRFIVGHLDILDALLKIKQADYSACKDDPSPAPCRVKWEGVIERMKKEGVPFKVKQLAVRGDELIEAGICPAQAGKALNYLLGRCASDVNLNRKEILISLALTGAAEGAF